MNRSGVRARRARLRAADRWQAERVDLNPSIFMRWDNPTETTPHYIGVIPNGVTIDAGWRGDSSDGSKIMIKSVVTFVADDSGATAIEYALITSLIAVFIIGALSLLGTSISSEFTEVSGALK